MLGAQGIHAMWFKRTQGNVHCSKFESGSNTDRMTFETNAICTTSDIQPPVILFTNCLIDGLPVLHGRIRGLYDLCQLAINLKARNAFPGKIPIMDGSGFPEATRKFILKEREDAKNWIRHKAKTGPLKMFLMTPDPHG